MLKNLPSGFLFLLLLIAAACNNSPAPSASNESTGATDDARLYFKNIRSPYYKIEKSKNTDSYQLRQWPPQNENFFSFSIHDNWLKNEVSLLFHSPLDSITFIAAHATGTDTFQYLKNNHFNQNFSSTALALALFEKLKNDQQIFILQKNGSKSPFFTDHQAKKALFITVDDYLNLINQ